MPKRSRLDEWLDKASALTETCKACGHKLSDQRCQNSSCSHKGEVQ